MKLELSPIESQIAIPHKPAVDPVHPMHVHFAARLQRHLAKQLRERQDNIIPSLTGRCDLALC
jgi:hypothetical protein